MGLAGEWWEGRYHLQELKSALRATNGNLRAIRMRVVFKIMQIDKVNRMKFQSILLEEESERHNEKKGQQNRRAGWAR